MSTESEIFDLQSSLTAPHVYGEEANSATEEVETTEESETPEIESEEIDEDSLLASEDETEQVESDTTKHRSKAAEKRIAKLVKEREQLKGQLALFQQNQQTQPQRSEFENFEMADPNAPDPSNYADGVDDIDYRLDLREYQREQIKKDTSFKQQIAAAIEKYSDLPALIEADESRTNATMAQLIKESSVSADLFYYLMKNPDVSNRIAAMSPAQSAKEIGKIEAKLEDKVKPTKTATKKAALPPPISPVKSTAATTLKPIKYTVY